MHELIIAEHSYKLGYVEGKLYILTAQIVQKMKKDGPNTPYVSLSSRCQNAAKQYDQYWEHVFCAHSEAFDQKGLQLECLG